MERGTQIKQVTKHNKRRVITPTRLPAQIPLIETIVMILLLDKIKGDSILLGIARGILIALILVWWLLALSSLALEERADVVFKERPIDPKKAHRITEDEAQDIMQRYKDLQKMIDKYHRSSK